MSSGRLFASQVWVDSDSTFALSSRWIINSSSMDFTCPKRPWLTTSRQVSWALRAVWVLTGQQTRRIHSLTSLLSYRCRCSWLPQQPSSRSSQINFQFFCSKRGNSLNKETSVLILALCNLLSTFEIYSRCQLPLSFALLLAQGFERILTYEC